MKQKIKSTQYILNDLSEERRMNLREVKALRKDYNKLSIEYQPILDELQDNANKLAKKFKKLFKKSQEAYKSGDGASAKSLSVTGHSIKDECIGLNNEANAMRKELKDLSRQIREKLDDLEDMEDYAYSLESKTIIAGFSKSGVIGNEEVKEIFNNLPRILTDKIEGINFVDRVAIKNARLFAGGNNKNERTEESLITIFDGFYESEQEKKEETIKTIYHEIGHTVFDKMMTDEQRCHWGNWFIESMENDNFINDIAEISRADDFCECFMKFHLKPIKLEDFDKRRYNFIKDIYSELRKEK